MRKRYQHCATRVRDLVSGSRLALSMLEYLLIRASASTRLGSSDRLGGHEAGGQWAGFEKPWTHPSVVAVVLPMILWAADGAGSDRTMASCSASNKSCSCSVCMPRERSCASTDYLSLTSMTDAGRPSPYRHWTNASRKVLEAA